MRSIDQQRAAFAWECVEKRFLGDSAPKADKRSTYCNLTKSAPALIMGNGLMQTLAYLEAKARKKNGERNPDAETGWLNDDVLSWLAKRLPELGPENMSCFREVMGKLHRASGETYQRASEEALELLRWLRQLAPALGSGKEVEHAGRGAEVRR